MSNPAEFPEPDESGDRSLAPFGMKPLPAGLTDPPFVDERPLPSQQPVDRFDPDPKEFRARWWPNLSDDWA